jgi:hypothetical protein
MTAANTLAGVVTALGSTSSPAAAATATGVLSPDTRYVAIGASIHSNSSNAGSNILSSSGYTTVIDHNYSVASCETNITIAQSTTNNVVSYQPITQAPGFSHVPKHAVTQLRFTGTGGGAPTWQTIDTASVVLGGYCTCDARTLAQTVQAIFGQASANLPAGASFGLRYVIDGVTVEETIHTVPASGVLVIPQRLHRLDVDLFIGCADQTHTAKLEFKCISISSNPANTFTSTAISLKATGV